MIGDEALARIGKLQSRNPRAVLLARLCSFAVLIEPQLMRRLRLDLVPNSRAMDEADLWFSRLVQSRNPEGIVMFPEVAEKLRAGLKEDDATQAWARTQKLHAGLPAAIRVEEELAFLSRDSEKNRTRIEDLLRAAISEMVAGHKAGLANWAGRALPRLPANIQDTAPATVLGIASDMRLGRNARLEERLGKLNRIPDWLSEALPNLNTTTVGVSLTSDGVEFGPATTYTATIKVPDTHPAVVEVRQAAGDGQSSNLVFIASGERTSPVPVATGPVQLLTLANQVYTLEPKMSTALGAIGPRLIARAYSESYAARICWSAKSAIPGCLGFALERRNSSSDTPIVLEQLEPFQTQGKSTSPTRASTMQSPIQRFSWWDMPQSAGLSVEYRVIPMAGGANSLQRLDDLASNWTPSVLLGPSETEPVSVYFNRASPYLGSLAASYPTYFQTKVRPSLEDTIATPGDQLRELLGGDLLRKLLALLAEAKVSQAEIYVAPFALSDPQLITELCAFGTRANVLLTETTEVKEMASRDAQVRAQLKKSGVRVVDRNVSQGHLIHNKFLAICDSTGQPKKVWTGNTSWTSRSLCMRSNAAIVIDSQDVAKSFVNQWNQLATAGAGFPAELVKQNGIPPTPIPVGSAKVTVQFTPVRHMEDLQLCERFIRTAQQGVLYVASESGRGNKLIQVCHSLKGVFVCGVQRQGPTATLYKLGQVFTAGSTPDVGPELKPILGRLGRFSASSVQSRIIVIDPFGDHPVVITGSHGFSRSASGRNDENLLIIENASELAARCATYIASLYDSHRGRGALKEAPGGSTSWAATDNWQDPYFTPEHRLELDFWVGARRKAPAVQPSSMPESAIGPAATEPKSPRFSNSWKERQTQPKSSPRRTTQTKNVKRAHPSRKKKTSGSKRSTRKSSGATARVTRRKNDAPKKHKK